MFFELGTSFSNTTFKLLPSYDFASMVGFVLCSGFNYDPVFEEEALITMSYLTTIEPRVRDVSVLYSM
jgi:hypothetical protein